MARAIQPFGTANDGDTLFAVTTGEVTNEELSFADLGTIASEVAWDAVLASVPELPERTPVAKEPAQIASERLDAVVGEYQLSPWARVRISRDGERLEVQGPEQWNLYFPTDETVALTPISGEEFLIEGRRGDRVDDRSAREGEDRGRPSDGGPRWIAPREGAGRSRISSS
jgi:hypothetical protein